MIVAPRRNARAFASAVVATVLLCVVALLAGYSTPSANAAEPVAASGTVSSEIVKAADLSQFQPGNIISDAVFYDKNTMTEQQIQAFLDARGPSCRSGYTCLKSYYDTTRSTTADAMCGAYSGGSRESAARIIYKVAQACGVNPQVILVMLQKEQGLVLTSQPSAYNYRAAMGQGCPDTAACDTRYYGFFNQVYGGVWQLKRYGNPPGTSQYFTWYAPGKTWNIQWNPNAGCGSSPVYVQNQATANLYYYTPYQPNAAAIRAGYGEGDGCSSYGNRNFYQFFTDWFGSTQSVASFLSAVGQDIYLLSGGKRYHIQLEDWPAFQAALGNPRQISSDLLARYADAGKATRYLHNTTTGVVSYLDGGQLHRFPTCDLVAAWGGSCSALTSVATEDFQSIESSSLEMTTAARASSGGRTLVMEGNALVPYYDQDVIAGKFGGSLPYAAVLTASAASRYTVLPTRFKAGTFVVTSADARVWLPTADGRLFYLPDWKTATTLGLRPVAQSVDQAAIAGFRDAGTLSAAVSCSGQLYVGSSGVLQRVENGSGFSELELDAQTCGVLNLSTNSAGKLFLQAAGDSRIYHAMDGSVRHVASMAQLTSLNGGSTPRVMAVSGAVLGTFRLGAPYLITGELVKSPTSARVYLSDGNTVLYVPTFDIIRDLGLSTTVRTVADFSAPSDARNAGVTIGCFAKTYTASQGSFTEVGAAVGKVDLSNDLCRVLGING